MTAVIASRLVALALAATGILLLLPGVVFTRQAWSCERGEQCMGPFAGYFVLGVPGFLAAAVAFGLAVALMFGLQSKLYAAAASAVVWVTAMVALTGVLWNT